jgi:hypothetical protein
MPLKSLTKDPLVVKKGIIQPSFGKKIHNSVSRTDLIPAGVLTSDGVPVSQSSGFIYERNIVRPVRINPAETDIKYIDTDAICFSITQVVFAHELVGTMAYAYPLLSGKYKDHKIVFIDTEPNAIIKTLLKPFGVCEENIITVKEYTQFRSVIVPEASFGISKMRRYRKRVFTISVEFINTFQAISKNFKDENSPRKVYFSRAKYGRPLVHEDKIERVFKNNGYEVFYPEKIPFEEQMRLVANADFLACVSGSLEHHSLFMKDGATLIVMTRRPKPTERQVLINKLQTTIKRIYLKAIAHPFGDRVMPNIIITTKELIKFFDEYGFAYDKISLMLTEQDINGYIGKLSWRDKEFRAFSFILNRFIRYLLVKQQKSLRK